MLSLLLFFVMLCGFLPPAGAVWADSGGDGFSPASASNSAMAVIRAIRSSDAVRAASPADWVLGVSASEDSLAQGELDDFLVYVLNQTGQSAGSKAKLAIALSALGIDARAIPDKADAGAVINLISDVESGAGDMSALDIYSTTYILSLCDLGIYEFQDEAALRAALIQDILSEQKENGEWTTLWGDAGVDGAAMALTALAPYYRAGGGVNGVDPASCAAITAAVDKALVYIAGKQGPDGGFGEPNCNTAATAAIGLAALGVDPHTDSRFVKDGKSVIDNILSFRTEGDLLGFADNTAANSYASVQGLQALVVWLNLTGGGRGDGLYFFERDVAQYVNWPGADLLTSLILTPPIKSRYQPGEAFTTEGIRLEAVYNSDIATRKTIPYSEYRESIAEPVMAPGTTQTVTITYKGHTASFVIAISGGAGSSAENPPAVSLTVTGERRQIIASGTNFLIEKNVTTVLDVLRAALNSAGKTMTVKEGGYVLEIDGLREFGQGENSGWLYYVNGTDPLISAGSYRLTGGERIEWKFTLDYRNEPGSSRWASDSGSGSGGVLASVEVESVLRDGYAVATVSGSDLNSIADKVKSGKDEQGACVRIGVKIAKDASGLQFTIPSSLVSAFSGKKNISLEIYSSIGGLTLDAAAINAAADSSGAKDAIIKIAGIDASELPVDVRELIGGRPAFDLSVTVNGREIADFREGKLTVSLPYELETGESAEYLKVYSVSVGNALSEAPGAKYNAAKKSVEFTTGRLSAFAIVYDALPKTPRFADVSDSHWAAGYIYDLVSRGVLTGRNDAVFAPGDSVTRAEFTAILFRMSGDAPSVSKNAFSDVAAKSWYAGYVTWAAEAGVVQGMGGLAFAPDAGVSREDMAVMILRYADYKGIKLSDSEAAVTFEDENQISGYARTAVAKIQKAGIAGGVGGGFFAPRGAANRAETAKMISGFPR
jgi:hypothetical protein